MSWFDRMAEFYMELYKPPKLNRPHLQNTHMWLEFYYNTRGFGNLRLINSGNIVDDYMCRTGSINSSGKLVNALPVGDWLCLEPSVDTTEVSMFIHEGKGWKIRLYRVTEDGYKWTRYLIHPDGGRVINNGTKGCIGILGSDATSFRIELDDTIQAYGTLPLYARKDNEEQQAA